MMNPATPLTAMLDPKPHSIPRGGILCKPIRRQMDFQTEKKYHLDFPVTFSPRFSELKLHPIT